MRISRDDYNEHIKSINRKIEEINKQVKKLPELIKESKISYEEWYKNQLKSK